MDLDLDPLMAAGSDLTSLEFASLRNWELGGTAALQGFGLAPALPETAANSASTTVAFLYLHSVFSFSFSVTIFCFTTLIKEK